jgi:pyruvate formate lyase activating enzyme
MTSNQGLIFDIQRYSVHDGPGIRTLVFLKGCPLSCLWCSNPESQKASPELAFRRTLCIGCGVCIGACPQRAISSRKTSIEIDRLRCNLCGECVRVCAPDALAIVGKWMTVEQVLAEVERDLCFYEKSGGGITLSGGEPLAQIDFSEALLKTCKASGLKTTIETAGDVPWLSIERLIKYVDLVLFDLKHINPSVHRQITGASNVRILENIRRLAVLEIPIIARCPVIPGFNDNPGDMANLFQFITELAGVRRIDLLPYHRLGESKYAMLGRDYALKGTGPPARENLEYLNQLAKKYNLHVRTLT